MEDVLFVASRVIGRRSVPTVCRNLLFLREDRRGASQVLILIRELKQGRNSHRVLRRLLLPVSLISIGIALRVSMRTFRLLRLQRVRVDMVLAIVVQDPAVAVLAREEATKGKER
ncbi:hypothetical protein PanWU01x14_338650 [Parasponia andersonii]|uniref:Uncharacterized protein n=1 Tax=Parasponia andersonii TaxID=3476 RepID=A0A2P5AF40_PARAD|nr:hypothetical protein PanWU01x14_338650 [Parasponia andersonii]